MQVSGLRTPVVSARMIIGRSVTGLTCGRPDLRMHLSVTREGGPFHSGAGRLVLRFTRIMLAVSSRFRTRAQSKSFLGTGRNPFFQRRTAVTCQAGTGVGARTSIELCSIEVISQSLDRKLTVTSALLSRRGPVVPGI